MDHRFPDLCTFKFKCQHNVLIQQYNNCFNFKRSDTNNEIATHSVKHILKQTLTTYVVVV